MKMVIKFNNSRIGTKVLVATGLSLGILVWSAGCSSGTDATNTGLDGGGGADGGGQIAIDSGVTEPTLDATSDAPVAVECTSAREKLLTPVASVSTGEVTVLSETGGVKTLFVDATAGGPPGAATNPRVYLALETGSRVALTDIAAATSTAWDLAIKRPVLFANAGDGGPGQGGAKRIDKAFDAVTAADATSLTFAPESFFDADCNAKVDQTGAVKTSFDGWYDYDQATNGLSPHAGTWIVKGGAGKLFKLEILSYYATPDGGVGMTGARYTLRVAAL
jgi:hypothetical protein